MDQSDCCKYCGHPFSAGVGHCLVCQRVSSVPSSWALGLRLNSDSDCVMIYILLPLFFGLVVASFGALLIIAFRKTEYGNLGQGGSATPKIDADAIARSAGALISHTVSIEDEMTRLRNRQAMTEHLLRLIVNELDDTAHPQVSPGADPARSAMLTNSLRVNDIHGWKVFGLRGTNPQESSSGVGRLLRILHEYESREYRALYGPTDMNLVFNFHDRTESATQSYSMNEESLEEEFERVVLRGED